MSAIVVRPLGARPIRITYGAAAVVRIVAVPGPAGPSGTESNGDLRRDLDSIDDLSLLFDNGLI